ncbi:MAG: DUF3685 domain-containing protein [Cyanobacteria bacterium J06638_28]
MIASALNLFLVDEDPVFRLGLQIWLDQRPEFAVIGTAATGEAGLQQITDIQMAAQTTATDASSPSPSPAVDVVIVDLALGQGNPEQLPGLQLCRDIKQQFPRLVVIVLSAQDAPVLQQATKQMGADGFGLRDAPVGELAMLIQQAVTPRATVAEPMQDIAFPISPPPLTATLRQNSLEHIEAALTEIEQASTRSLPYWYRVVLAGQSRELKAARWLVQQLFPQSNSPQPEDAFAGEKISVANPLSLSNRIPSPTALRRQSSAASIIPVEATRTRVCDAIFRKLQFPLDNGSDVPLEIDILRLEKRRELLYTTLQIFERLLDDLQQAAIPLGQLEAQVPAFLQDLWHGVTVDFFGRYYTPPVNDLEQPMATVLRQDATVVQAEILNHIPQVTALLAHLLFQTTLEVEGADYMATTPEALRHSQFLLENLLIQVACGVMQPVLNRYSDVEALKRHLFHRHRRSTRDLVRFRNDLSWRYRWDAAINEPKAIFESQYRLFAITPEGIQKHYIYAPRTAELSALTGVQYFTTLALEIRDALSPRVRTTIAFLGSGVVFVLTEVIGRGIGLVGRGMVKGIGNAWQEGRLRQRRRDEA